MKLAVTPFSADPICPFPNAYLSWGPLGFAMPGMGSTPLVYVVCCCCRGALFDLLLYVVCWLLFVCLLIKTVVRCYLFTITIMFRWHGKHTAWPAVFSEGEFRCTPTPGLNHKISVFSDPDPGKHYATTYGQMGS